MSTGHRPVALDAAADLEPVEPGQHQVEHDEVGAHALAQRDAGGPVVRRPRPSKPSARRRAATAAAITASSSTTQMSGAAMAPSVPGRVRSGCTDLVQVLCRICRACGCA